MSDIKTPLNGAGKTLLQAALFAAISAAAFAPATSIAQTAGDPNHWHNSQGLVWKNSTGLCWRSGSWTPADATAECDPELMAKAEAPAPKAVEAMAPPPAPMPAPQTRKVTFSAEELFDFDKAVLRPAGKARLDKLVEELGNVNDETLVVTGHTDRIGTHRYNQKLSEARASAVNAYLVGKGVPDKRTTSTGVGETQPVTKPGDCKGPVSKKLIACLQADRRVEIDVTGSKEVPPAQ
jgi:OmpA-OmpF porin, OOP family